MRELIDRLMTPRGKDFESIEELNWKQLAASGVIVGALATSPVAHANSQDTKIELNISGEKVNMDVIKDIESSGNPKAYNEESEARGLYQITPIVLEEWNNYHSNEKYKLDDLFNADINEKIAKWYMYKRIPQMIKHYGKKDTVENRIIAYNAGIDYVLRSVSFEELPKETQEYLEKYHKRIEENIADKNIIKGIMGV